MQTWSHTPLLQYGCELSKHGLSAHPLYAQSLFAEQPNACASPIKHVVTRHARSAAATPMLGISEAVGALYRRGCSSAAPAVTKEWLAGWQPTRWSAASQARNDGQLRPAAGPEVLPESVISLQQTRERFLEEDASSSLPVIPQ